MTFSIQRIATRRGSKPRAVFAHALLIAVLLIAQLGAFTHALSHFALDQKVAEEVTVSTDLRDDSSGPAQHKTDSFCALCSAFAGVAATLINEHRAIAATSLSFVAPARDAPVLAPLAFFSFSSRAPPAG